MQKSTKLGSVFVIVGLVIPQLIDLIETANSLNIKRDFGVLPWLILSIIGAGLLIHSLVRKLKN